MSKNFIVGLDIGTAKIKAAVLDGGGKKPAVRALFKEQSGGLKKGAIFDVTEAAQSVGRVLSEIRRISKNALRNVYVNIGTPQVKSQTSRGVVAVSRADNEIYKDDIDRVVRASQAVNLGQNRMIIHTLTRDFMIDGVGDIFDPLGMSGSRLEVNSLVVDAFSPHVKSLVKVVELMGGDVGGLVFSPLAASRAVLTKDQKDLGIVMVDIGFGTTGLSVYEDGRLVTVSKFPVGAGNISNDLAVGLKIPVLAAENLKLNYGHAFSRSVGARETIELAKLSPESRGAVSRRFVADIIEARLSEIFEFVNNELKLIGRAGKLVGGVVFVGGGAKLPGLTELAKQELKLFSQVGFSVNHDWLELPPECSEAMEDPEFSGAVGLALWGADQEGWLPKEEASGILGRIKKFIGSFNP